MTPAEARLIIQDGCLQTLIDATTPEEWPELSELHKALVKLGKELKRLAKRKKK